MTLHLARLIEYHLACRILICKAISNQDLEKIFKQGESNLVRFNALKHKFVLSRHPPTFYDVCTKGRSSLHGHSIKILSGVAKSSTGFSFLSSHVLLTFIVSAGLK